MQINTLNSVISFRKKEEIADYRIVTKYADGTFRMGETVYSRSEGDFFLKEGKRISGKMSNSAKSFPQLLLPADTSLRGIKQAFYLFA